MNFTEHILKIDFINIFNMEFFGYAYSAAAEALAKIHNEHIELVTIPKNKENTLVSSISKKVSSDNTCYPLQSLDTPLAEV